MTDGPTQWSHFGEITALTAALLFSWVAILFTSAGRRLGPATVNLLRLPGGLLCLATLHWLAHGSWWPRDASGTAHLWLGASGVVGLAVGDSVPPGAARAPPRSPMLPSAPPGGTSSPVR